MTVDQYRNIFLDETGEIRNYISRRQGGRKPNFPLRDRLSHGRRMQYRLNEIWRQVEEIDQHRTAISLSTRQGTYLEFESAPNFDLVTKSLEDMRKGVRLLKVREEEVQNGTVVKKATVFIPKGKENYFLNKVNSYINEDDRRNNKPKNNSLVSSIENIKLAVLESFWTGRREWIPQAIPLWCEVWLNIDSDETEAEFREFIRMLNVEIKEEKISFPERRVVFIKANREKLQQIIEGTRLIAELRRATETAAFFIDLENKEQTEWANELLKRLNVIPDVNTYISLLDTGVNNGHMLINPVLGDEDCFTYKSDWNTSDHDGHGTRMAGICIFKDLQAALESNEDVVIDHYLESCKILPPNGENSPELYGAITSQAVSNLIIDKPARQRIICMAVTAPKYETGDGSPSSWSSAIDELTSGYIDGIQKLFLVSAGNINDRNEWSNYPESNKTLTVQNPGQAWNAITVGAYTEKCTLDFEKYGEKEVVAQVGQLSPYSTTSILWESKWPIKPEIVLEGGNLIKDSYGCFECEDLSLLTTNYKPNQSQFSTVCATSAAVAQASWMAAKLQSMYPNAWPETIRALLIHSAEWTNAMKEQFLGGRSKADYRVLLRTCGYGVPNLERAIRCTSSNVNLIIQSELQPFEKRDSKYKSNEMHIHEIPWPKEVLEELFDTPVKMKVTLSYFIEPGPGEIGWKDRYRYPSCALRFDVNGTDTKEVFINRISKAIDEEDDEVMRSGGGNVKWLLGSNNRNVGSIHSDVWEGTAAELATSNLIAVYPAVGWWRERHHLGRWNRKIRYSLIVSISTPEVTADLYTPIISMIEIKNKAEVEIPVPRI